MRVYRRPPANIPDPDFSQMPVMGFQELTNPFAPFIRAAAAAEPFPWEQRANDRPQPNAVVLANPAPPPQQGQHGIPERDVVPPPGHEDSTSSERCPSPITTTDTTTDTELPVGQEEETNEDEKRDEDPQT